MPNWTDNVVEVSGTKKDLFEFQEFVKGDSYTTDDGVKIVEEFSLNSIKPLPLELKNVASPVRVIPDDEYDEAIKKHKEYQESTKFSFLGLPITETHQKELIKDYGYDNWYDWSVANWGTKWDVSSEVHNYRPQISEVDKDSQEQGSLSYAFDTAWSPPEPIYTYLQDRFPNLEIDWQYKGEGYDFCGNLRTGECIEFPCLETIEEVNELKARLSKSSIDTYDWDVEFEYLEEQYIGNDSLHEDGKPTQWMESFDLGTGNVTNFQDRPTLSSSESKAIAEILTKEVLKQPDDLGKGV